MLQHIIPYQAKLSPYIIPGLKGKRTQTTSDIILDAVCNSYGIVLDVLIKRRRFAKLVEPRYIAMYLLCYYTEMTKKDIGKLLGGYDHTTVIHARKQMNDLLCTDVNLAKRLLQIKNSAEISDKVPNRYKETTL